MNFGSWEKNVKKEICFFTEDLLCFGCRQRQCIVLGKYLLEELDGIGAA